MKGIVNPSALVTDLGARERPTVISVVSARGKAGLPFWLAELLQTSGGRVLITTTTHMFMSTSRWPVVFCHDPAMLPHVSLTFPISFCFHNWKASQGEVQGLTPEAIDALVQRPECGVTLIEADSSRGMSLKAPDEYEPCVPKSSCYMIAVMGGHALSTKVSTENVHRWSQLADVTGLTPDVILQLNGSVALVRHPQGAFENIPQSCRRVWFISRFSQYGNATAQSELLQPLQQHDVEAVWLGDIQERPAIARRSVNQWPGYSGLLKGYSLKLV